MSKILECTDCGMSFFGTEGRNAQPLCRKCEELEILKVMKKELISLNLWSARILHPVQSEFAYKELEKITGENHEKSIDIDPQNLTSICLKCGVDLGKCICENKDNPFFKGYKPNNYFNT